MQSSTQRYRSSFGMVLPILVISLLTIVSSNANATTIRSLPDFDSVSTAIVNRNDAVTYSQEREYFESPEDNTLSPTTQPTKEPTSNLVGNYTVNGNTKYPTSSPTEMIIDPHSSNSPTTRKPTKNPTKKPTRRPTKTNNPTVTPTRSPIKAPTTSPIRSPTNSPVTIEPTQKPNKKSPTSRKPTKSPALPTKRPVFPFTHKPTKNPIIPPAPTKVPVLPTVNPTFKPTSLQTPKPTKTPTLQTESPTKPTTPFPTTLAPSVSPTLPHPSTSPTTSPTNKPTSSPTKNPTKSPTSSPTINACPPGYYYQGSAKGCDFFKFTPILYSADYLKKLLSISKSSNFIQGVDGICSTLKTVIVGKKQCWKNGKPSSFSDAIDTCERDGMRLCTSAEVLEKFVIPAKGSTDEECYSKTDVFWTSTPCRIDDPKSNAKNGRRLERLDGSGGRCNDETDPGTSSFPNRVACCADVVTYSNVHSKPCLGCITGSSSVISTYLAPATGENKCIYGAVPPPTSGEQDFTHAPTFKQRPKSNILLIVVDDLKAGLVSGYGDENSNPRQTPNIDALMKRGIAFSNAHAQQAECGPSRSSFLTGRRPDFVGVTDFITNIRDRFSDLVTLPQIFKENGYRTVIGYGKVFDGRNSGGDSVQDFPLSWTKKIYNPFDQQSDYVTDPAILGNCGYGDVSGRYAMTQCAQFANDITYLDGKYAEQAAVALDPKSLMLAAPWFLAVGFAKPHLPFLAPKKYWDRYQREEFLPLVQTDEADEGMPLNAYAIAHSDNQEFSKYGGFPSSGKQKADPPTNVRLQVYHGYYSAAAYVDEQVGYVLRSLSQRPKEEQDNTLIVLLGDHGYHLGDHNNFAKGTVYEQATRVPLIVVPPKIDSQYDSSRGKISSVPVELVDLYPTVVDISGVLGDICETNSTCLPNVDGISLSPIMKDVDNHSGLSKFAISQYPTYSKDRATSYALRTSRFRFIVHVEGSSVIKGKILGRELYDYVADKRERINVYADPAYASIAKEFDKMFSTHRSLRWQSIKGSSPFDALFNMTIPSG